MKRAPTGPAHSDGDVVTPCKRGTREKLLSSVWEVMSVGSWGNVQGVGWRTGGRLPNGIPKLASSRFPEMH